MIYPTKGFWQCPGTPICSQSKPITSLGAELLSYFVIVTKQEVLLNVTGSCWSLWISTSGSHPFSFQCEPRSWVGTLTGAQQRDTSNEWVWSWQKGLNYQCWYSLTGWPWDSAGTSLSFCSPPARAMAMILPRVLVRFGTQRWPFPSFHLPAFSNSSHLPLATVTVTSLIHALTGASISGLWQLSWRPQKGLRGKTVSAVNSMKSDSDVSGNENTHHFPQGESISQTSVNEK